VAAGDVVSVALTPPPPPPPVAANVPPPTATTPVDVTRDEGAHRGVLPPAVVYVGAAATAIATGITIWSAVDTEQARTRYNGTEQALQDGLGRERRTNVLVTVSGGLGAVTLLSMLLLVDWHKHPAAKEATVKVGVGLGSFALHGSF
jgi:hypothetical protein